MTKADAVLIVSIMAITALIWVGFRIFPEKTADMVAVVRVDGKEIMRLPVTGSTINRAVVKIPRGEATIEYGQGKVRVLPLDDHVCPNGICWRTGWISVSGQSIVCVPNHMTITLEAGNSEVDSVVR
ncbi:MAG TPA: NusG domain II-containing protein [Firmicutes bacterium]|nr:NusG domain II-containing protein [Candidatus Fermentithermobacillaceae bacterium]